MSDDKIAKWERELLEREALFARLRDPAVDVRPLLAAYLERIEERLRDLERDQMQRDQERLERLEREV